MNVIQDRKNQPRILIYGAYGHTGLAILNRLANENIPYDMAGRNAQKLNKLKDTFDGNCYQFAINDYTSAIDIIKDYQIFINCAGPYKKTALTLAKICIDAQCNYVDLSGEINVLKMLETLDEKAKEKSVAIVPAAGFCAVPTMLFLKKASDYFSSQNTELCSADIALEYNDNRKASFSLAILFAILNIPHRCSLGLGSIRTTLLSLQYGSTYLDNQKLLYSPLGKKQKIFTSNDKKYYGVLFNWADLFLAQRSSFLSSLKIFIVMKKWEATLLKLLWPALLIFRIPWLGLLLSIFPLMKKYPLTERTFNSNILMDAKGTNGIQYSVTASLENKTDNKGNDLTVSSLLIVIQELSNNEHIGFRSPVDLLDSTDLDTIAGLKYFENQYE